MSKLEELIQKYCPDGVEYRHLGDFCEIRTGKGITKKTVMIVENILSLVVVSPQWGSIIPSTERNTVTISRVGANAGLVSFIDKRFYLNDKCFSVIPSDSTNTKFLYYVLSAKKKR